MADPIEVVEKGETIVIFVLVGVAIYFIYTSWNDLQDWLGNLMGASSENTYGNALGQTLAHPVQTMGSIIGIGQGSSGGQSDLPSDVSSVGYTKVGASGQHWSCTGPRGAANDACMPYDPTTNKVTGPGGLAVNCD